eukprot:Pgem_evm1s11317
MNTITVKTAVFAGALFVFLATLMVQLNLSNSSIYDSKIRLMNIRGLPDSSINSVNLNSEEEESIRLTKNPEHEEIDPLILPMRKNSAVVNQEDLCDLDNVDSYDTIITKRAYVTSLPHSGK